jgi:hypothetical protein
MFVITKNCVKMTYVSIYWLGTANIKKFSGLGQIYQ